MKAKSLSIGLRWKGRGSRFPLCLFHDNDNQVCFFPSCCEAIISSSLLSSHRHFLFSHVAPQSKVDPAVVQKIHIELCLEAGVTYRRCVPTSVSNLPL